MGLCFAHSILISIQQKNHEELQIVPRELFKRQCKFDSTLPISGFLHIFFQL